MLEFLLIQINTRPISLLQFYFCIHIIEISKVSQFYFSILGSSLKTPHCCMDTTVNQVVVYSLDVSFK